MKKLLLLALTLAFGVFNASFSQNPDPCITGNNTTTCDEHITNVTLNTINNDSECDFYSDYTDITTVLEPGESYPVTVGLTSNHGGVTYEGDVLGIWVDWNDDGSFDESEAVGVIAVWEVNSASMTLTVPQDIGAGTFRMRVVLAYNYQNQIVLDPCYMYADGEAEDYYIIIEGEEPVICYEPEEFDIESFEEGTVTVMIDGDGEYEVIYGPTGFDQEEGTSIFTEDEPMVDIETEGLPVGTYDVYVRTVCGDENSAWVGPLTFEVEETSGLVEFGLNGVVVYPNPASESVTIQLNEVNNINVTVYDLTGKVVISVDEVNSNQVVFNVANLNSGIYQVAVQTEAGQIVSKLVKK